MNNKRITIITREQLRAWSACYDDECIAALVPAAGLNPLEILDLDIPVEDRLWVVFRESVIPARELRLLACLWAERALDSLAPEHVDPRSREAIRVARAFADGQASAEDLETAQEDARAARPAAARAAACAAAWAADADAARAAACAAAWAAADADAEADEMRLEDVRRVLSGGEVVKGDVANG